jgi:putative ABC transport system permease protein
MNLMIKGFLRKLKRPEFQIIIAVIGLTITITNALLFYKYYQSEMSYDKFHVQEQSIFRVLRVIYKDGDKNTRYRGAEYPLPVGPAISKYFDEIEYHTRFTSVKATVLRNESVFNEYIHFADADFFKIFSFPMKGSNNKDAIRGLNQVVLSSKMSEKYFGTDDPLGKTIDIKVENSKRPFVVSGVMEDLPNNSSLKFDILINMENFGDFIGRRNVLTNWMGQWGVPAFVLLKDSKYATSINDRFEVFTSQHFEEDLKRWREKNDWKEEINPFSFQIQPMDEVHMGVDVYKGKGYTVILLFSMLVLFTVLIAGISYGNVLFINLSKKLKTISLKRILGSSAKAITLSVYFESAFFVLLSLILSLGIIESVLPVYKVITGIDFSYRTFYDLSTIFVILGLLFVIGVIPAIYPSLHIHKLTSKRIVPTKYQLTYKNNFIKFLVVFQFVISVVLIFSSVLIGKQINIYANKDLGYEEDHLITILTQDRSPGKTKQILEIFRAECLKNPDIVDVSSSNASFGLSVAPRDDSENFSCHYNSVDFNFFKTIGANLSWGRDFVSNSQNEANYAIINEKYADTYGLISPIGMKISETVKDPKWIGPSTVRDLEIIGVVDDFNFGPLTYDILPAIFYNSPNRYQSRLLIKTTGKNHNSTIEYLEQIWKQNSPEIPFEYYFLKDRIASSYSMQSNLKKVIVLETWIAVLISIFGMLSFFSAIFTSKVRDLVIRRVYGGTLFDIVKNELKYFVLLAVLANIIAFPIGYFMLNRLFENFTERISFDVGIVLISLIFSLIIVLLVILYNAIKTYYIDIIKTLKVN